jgi:hypothetical protein
MPDVDERRELVVSQLRRAREALCIAQTVVESGLHRDDLQTALNRIDIVGVWYPGWSAHADPPLPGADDG